MTTLVRPLSLAEPLAWSPYEQLPVAVAHGPQLVLELPKKLESPNTLIWRHWRRLSDERRQWERLIWAALVRGQGGTGRGSIDAPTCTVPMRIGIVRGVASRRQFIRDDDNLAFAAKPVHDALTRVGLIADDRREWLRTAHVRQVVSPDGRPRTTIALAPLTDDGGAA